jgi:hypothetical protein
MSPLYLYNGKLLVRSGGLAAAQSCCCDCPEYTAYVRSGFGSNGVPTFDGSPFWTADNGPTLSGSIWIWSSYLVANPTQTETFSLNHSFSVPANAAITSVVFRVAADNFATISVNGVTANIPASFNRVDGVPVAVPLNTLVPGGANLISGTVTNLGGGPDPRLDNPAGIIYTLKYTYKLC